jgi:hypothetical protein
MRKYCEKRVAEVSAGFDRGRVPSAENAAVVEEPRGKDELQPLYHRVDEFRIPPAVGMIARSYLQDLVQP